MNENEQRTKCIYCGKDFTTKGMNKLNIERHLKSHTVLIKDNKSISSFFKTPSGTNKNQYI